MEIGAEVKIHVQDSTHFSRFMSLLNTDLRTIIIKNEEKKKK